MATTVRASDSIGALDLPIRAHNALWRNNVREVGELVNLSDVEFLRMRGVGATTLEEVHRILAAHGLSMRAEPLPPADPAAAAEAQWIGRQIGALAEDSHVYAQNGLGTRWTGDGAAILNRRRAWAWYRWGTTPDGDWPRDKPGGFGFMAAPLPGSVELHLEGLNRLAHQELSGE